MQRIFDTSNRSLSPLGRLVTATALVLALALFIGTIPPGGAEPAHTVVAVHAAAAPANVLPAVAADKGASDDGIPPAELVPSAAYN